MKRPEQLPIMQAPTIAMIIAHTKYRIGTCIEQALSRLKEKQLEKLRQLRGSNLQPCAPLSCQATLFPPLADPVLWCSG